MVPGETRVSGNTAEVGAEPLQNRGCLFEIGRSLAGALQPSGRELVKLQNRGDGILDHFAINAPDLEKCVAEALKKTWHSTVPRRRELSITVPWEPAEWRE